MPTYQVEMLWTCRICKNADNLGLSKHCTNCGKPKDDRDEEHFPDDLSEAAALTGEKQKKALAGPDWKCKYCQTLQNSLGPCCGECGCDQNTGTIPWTGPSLIATEDGSLPRVVAIRVDPPTHSGARGGSGSPFDDQKVQPIYPAAAKSSAPPVNTSNPVEFDVEPPVPTRPFWTQRVVLGLIGIPLLLVLLWLVFRTKVVEAQVTALAWEHRVVVDRYQVDAKDGWDPDPSAFNVQDHGPRIHHYDHVRVGSHQESYQESYSCGQNCTTPSCYTTSRNCTSNKNGTATCTGGDRICPSPVCTTKYCNRTAYRTVDDYEDQARYRDWYSWNVWEWALNNRTVKHAGTTLDTSWPSEQELQAPLAEGEKERTRQEASYKITFTVIGDKDTYSIEPSTLDVFKQYPLGSHRRLKVGIASGVVVVPEGGR
jgi:hypothetical protein